MYRKALKTLGALLLAFHAWLLISQVWDGQLADLALLGRWAAAAGLVWALWSLRRQGAPMFWGRKAVAIWLLAALLHGPALAERFDARDAPALPEIAVTLARSTLSLSVLAGVLLFLALIVRARQSAAARRPVLCLDQKCRGLRTIGAHFVFLPRPPPLA